MKGRGIQVNDSKSSGEFLDVKIIPKLNADGLITSGLVIGNTVEQNKAFLLMAYPGEFRGDPDLGVGMKDILLDDDLLPYRHKIREQFAKDGLKIKRLELYDTENIEIIADYED